ncbi:MAG: prolyl hydroxylase family protein [Cyanobium sp.]
MSLPLSPDWRDWLRLNRDRGCDRLELFRRAAQRGFDPEVVSLELGLASPASGWSRPPLLDPAHEPRGWRLDTERAQIVEIPALLSRAECQQLIVAIEQALVPSTVTRGPGDYRTSQTCHLAQVAPELCHSLDVRFAALLGVDASLAEPLQGQRYGPGEYFKAHTDWFAPGTDEFVRHTRVGGQRTWTLMVYLNAVKQGGETLFSRIGRAFTPVAGMGLAWNNLDVNGEPNQATLHEALPVLVGRKYVITKWFRQQPGRLAAFPVNPSSGS